jgi:pimeloyl-ACP methyl ester carboxylesterase
MADDRRRFLTGGALAGAVLLAGAAKGRAAGDPSPMVVMPMPPTATVTEGVAHLPEADLWYSDTGGPGEPILLLHPLTGSGHVWGYQQPVFAGAGYRTIAYSRRDYRGSGSGPAERPGTGADDLRALVDHLGIGRFHAVGTAGGAFVAAAFAIAWPERLHTLTLACTVVRAEGEGLPALQSAMADPAIAALPADLRELGPSYRALDPIGHARWKELAAQARNGGASVSQPPGAMVTLTALSALRVPTLLMAGDADLIAPPPFARLFARSIPNSELVILTESGHSGYWERPDQFNRAVLDFIGRHRGG